MFIVKCLVLWQCRGSNPKPGIHSSTELQTQPQVFHNKYVIMAFPQYQRCLCTIYYLCPLKDQKLDESRTTSWQCIPRVSRGCRSKQWSVCWINTCMNKKIIWHPVTDPNPFHITVTTSKDFLRVGARTGESNPGLCTCVCSTTELHP